jgi:hypothetical protein
VALTYQPAPYPNLSNPGTWHEDQDLTPKILTDSLFLLEWNTTQGAR